MNQEKWQRLSLAAQMGNIGAEIVRAINWQEKNEAENSSSAVYRAIELIDLTTSDSRWQWRLKEIFRLREVVCDIFFGKNEYNTSQEKLKGYFLSFALVA